MSWLTRRRSYRGMGSIGAMREKHGSADNYFQDTSSELEKLVPEGIEGRVAYKRSLVAILYQLAGGLRAAMGYTGSNDIEQMRTRPVFVRITSGALRERLAAQEETIARLNADRDGLQARIESVEQETRAQLAQLRRALGTLQQQDAQPMPAVLSH